MPRVNANDKYPSCSLRLIIDDDFNIPKKDLKAVSDRLKLCGGNIYVSGNFVEIRFEKDNFVKARTRNAGPHKKPLVLKETGNFATYADIVYWHYGLKESWDTIAKKFDVSRSAFFRTKKLYYEKYYGYKEYLENVDLTKASDLEYLKTIYRHDDIFI